MTFRFGCYLLREQDQQLLRDGEPVAVTSKALTTLLILVRAQGKVVTRDQLRAAVWPDSFVEEGSLAQNIFVLRKLLAPDFREGNPIETLPRIGYRFQVPVEIVPVQNRSPLEAPVKAAPAQSSERDVARGEFSEETSLPRQGLEPAKQPERRAGGSLLARRGVLAGLIVLGLIGDLWRLHHAHSARQQRRTITIPDFRNLAADPAQTSIGVCVAELLKSSLGDINQIPTLNTEGNTVALFPPDPEAGNRQGRSLLNGTYLMVGNELRLDAQLEVLGSEHAPSFFSVHGDVSRLADLTARLSGEIRHQMGIPAPASPGDPAQQLRSAEAARFYAEGLQAYERLNLPVARVLLERAAQTDPAAANVHLSLAETWAAFGNETQAAREADLAGTLAPITSVETRLKVLAMHAATSGHWDQAVRLDLTLWKCWPEEQAFAVDLANALHQAGRDREARGILTGLGNFPLSAELKMRQQLALCEVEGALGDFRGEGEIAAKLIAASQPGRDHAPIARALLYQAESLEQLGQLESALRSFSQSKMEADAGGDTTTEMRASIGDANLIAKMGRPAPAAEQLQGTLALARQADAASAQLECLLALGTVYRESKALDLSLAASTEALALAQHLGSGRDAAAAYLGLGQTEIYLGRAAKARQDLDTALAQASTTSDASLKIGALGALGFLDYTQGDLRTSSTLLEQAVHMDDSAGGRELAAHYMGRLSQVLIYEGRETEANNVLATWCAYEAQTQNHLDLAGCELFRSQADEQAGQTRKAQQEILEVLARSSDPLVTAEAHRQLALVLLRESNLFGAQNAIERAQAESRGMLNEEDYLLPIGIAAARVEAASGAVQSAVAQLSTIQHRAELLNFMELKLEAKYASDELELRENPVQALRKLQAFKMEAETAGFVSFGNQAAKLLRQQKGNDTDRPFPLR